MTGKFHFKGPEGGWTWGGIGSLIWLALIGVLFLCQGKAFAGVVTLMLFV